jgi:predicted permease
MSLFGWRSRGDRREELDEELRSHLVMDVNTRVARGDAVADAELAARREFGNVTKIRVATEDSWGSAWADHARQDLRYALRGLARSPGFTITVALTFALGVGANAAVFSIVEPLLLRTPPGLVAPGRLHRIYHGNAGDVGQNFSGATYSGIRDALAGMASVTPRLTTDSATLVTNGLTIDVRREYATAGYLPLLTGPAALGRYFTAEEGDARAPLTRAVLSHAFWQTAFGGDRNILGRQLRIGDASFTVVGVAPPGFVGLDVTPVNVWTTAPHFARTPEPWYQWANKKFGTLILRETGSAHLRQVASRATIAWHQHNFASESADSQRSILLGSIVEGRGPGASRELRVSARLAGVAFIVLLVACANIATLALVRTARRRREIAVRVALGVRRGRLVRQMMAETMLLAGVGGVAAVALAAWGGTALRTMLMPNTVFPAGVLSPALFVAIALLSIVSGILSGVAPAVQNSRPDLTQSLKEGSRTGKAAGSRLRSLLLVGQSALSVVLIVGAGLFIRSLVRLNAVDIGIDASRTIIVGLRPTTRTDEQLSAVMNELADRVRAVPGVERVTLATSGPFLYWNTRDAFLPGTDTSVSLGGQLPAVIGADSTFFRTLGLRMLRGRSIEASDRVGDAPVVVVTESLARAAWPGADPLGKCLIPFERSGRCYTVVGVTNDFHQWGVVEAPRMRYIMSIDQMPLPRPGASQMYVRAQPEFADAATAQIRDLVREIMPTARVMWLSRLSNALASELRPWRVGAGLFIALGLLALTVATIGVYSVLAYALSQRVREMGVRIALGARSGDVHRLVLWDGLRTVLIGSVVGVVLALALGRLVASLLYGVSARDPITMIASVLVLLIAGAMAGLLPAWRASRVDPVVALRAD